MYTLRNISLGTGCVTIALKSSGTFGKFYY